MMKSTLHIMMLIFVTQCGPIGSSKILYINNSKVNFQKWSETTNPEGSLSFKFKTYKPKGMLFYVSGSENGRKNELRLTLNGGKLVVKFKMGGDDYKSMKDAELGSGWNDMNWHQVTVIHRYRDVTVRIDEHEKILSSEGEAKQFYFTSKVVMGSKHEEGFTACIKDVQYPVGSKIMGNPENYFKVCLLDRCTKSCKNDGKCTWYPSAEEKCDCSSTGYKGELCTEKEREVQMLENQVIVKSEVTLRSSRTNAIKFRFSTHHKSGIILYTGIYMEFILIELMEGNVLLKVALGTDEVTIRGAKQVHDGEWHSVSFERTGRNVVLIIDGVEKKASFMYYPTQICEKSERRKVYFGGHPYPQHITQSLSKKNFRGCMQQVYYQPDNVNKKIKNEDWISNVLDGKSVKVEDNSKLASQCVLWKRIIPLTTTTVKTTTTTTTTTTSTTSGYNSLASKNVSGPKRKNKLSKTTVAWITGGICVGSVALILTLACGFYFLRKKYRGQFSAGYKPTSGNKGNGIPQELMGNEPYPTNDSMYHCVSYHSTTSLKKPRPSVVL